MILLENQKYMPIVQYGTTNIRKTWNYGWQNCLICIYIYLKSSKGDFGVWKIRFLIMRPQQASSINGLGMIKRKNSHTSPWFGRTSRKILYMLHCSLKSKTESWEKVSTPYCNYKLYRVSSRKNISCCFQRPEMQNVIFYLKFG